MPPNSQATGIPAVNQRLSFDGALCTVRYVGAVAGTAGGVWLGVEWDDPSRGKHDGVHKGVRYFTCRRRAQPTAASFVRPTRPADAPRAFLAAVRAKYASESPTGGTTGGTLDGDEGSTSAVAAPAGSVPGRPIVISGKVAEEVGFDKVRRQLAQIETLRVVILDGMCVVSAGDADENDADNVRAIRSTCPSITDLDLSRNLFTQFTTVATICRELPGLRHLRINGNRFANINDEAVATSPVCRGAFDGVQELGVGDTLLSWAELGQILVSFPALASLSAGANQFARLWPPLPSAAATLATTLTTLGLEFNDFTALSDLASVAELRALRNLLLKGCRIATVEAAAEVAAEADNDAAPGVQAAAASRPSFSFSPSLQYVDLSYNCVGSWAFVDALPDVFPGLTSLRFSHNPIYNNPNLESDAIAATSVATTAGSSATTASTEESYMVTVGRLARLHALNFSSITPTDRANAEMFYLSRIAKQLAAVAEGAPAAAVLARHRRYPELCELYGEPAVVRHTATNPAFLEARLVKVDFYVEAKDAGDGKVAQTQKSVEIPKSFDMYTVKGLAGRLFGRSPQKLRLVWETGEWDPVAGVDEEEEDEEDEREEEAAVKGALKQGTAGDLSASEAARGQDSADSRPEAAAATSSGRWVRREVELRDSPRQFGFCVDGMAARIRLEAR